MKRISRVNMIESKYQEAVKMVRKLKEEGYEAYFVGGWVRDKLLGIVDENTDIDIATSCPIQEIPKIFSDCVYVGMVFGVCIVKIKGGVEEEYKVETLACGSDSLGNPISRFSEEKKIKKKKVYYEYDVATFRWDGLYEDGRHPNEVKIKAVSVEEDASRRDFTINALYYDPIGVCWCIRMRKTHPNTRLDHDCGMWKTKDRILDFVGGQEDLKKKIIRAIGSPRDRFKEDKLRMIRAVRLSFQLKFQIETKTEQVIRDLANELLPAVSYERIWQEMDKANKCSNFDYNISFMRILDDLGLLEKFIPEAKKWNGIWWEGFEDDDKSLPRKTPTLIRIMVMLGTFEKDKVLEITKRFGLKKSNWIE